MQESQLTKCVYYEKMPFYERCVTPQTVSRDGVVSIETRLQAGWRTNHGLIRGIRKRFVSSKAPRPTVGPMRCPIQVFRERFTRLSSGRGIKLNTYRHRSLRLTLTIIGSLLTLPLALAWLSRTFLRTGLRTSTNISLQHRFSGFCRHKLWIWRL